MKKLYLLVVIFLGCRVCEGQNLVPNGDFEQYSGCPTWYTQIDSALYWFSPSIGSLGGSPEYFNQCATGTEVDVPLNDFGYQVPHSGVGYSGITLWIMAHTFREYIETPLISPLIANTTYHFEMYISLADSFKYTTDAIGIYFSDSSINGIMNWFPLAYTPQLNNSIGNYPDALNWTLVNGDYTAFGGENYLIVGNFKDDLSTTAIPINLPPLYDAVYIYIDDVSLTPVTNIANGYHQDINLNIYPNPFNNQFSVSYIVNEPSEIILYDLTSRKILQQSFTTSTTLNTSQLSKGMYLYELRNKNSVVKKGKVVKE